MCTEGVLNKSLQRNLFNYKLRFEKDKKKKENGSFDIKVHKLNRQILNKSFLYGNHFFTLQYLLV